MQLKYSIWRHVAGASVLYLGSFLTTFALADPHSYTPPGGMIPNAVVARELAMVYLTAFYGKGQIESQLPLVVSLQNKVWTVKGSLNRKHSVGGVAEIDLTQQDGKVLRLTHSM